MKKRIAATAACMMVAAVCAAQTMTGDLARVRGHIKTNQFETALKAVDAVYAEYGAEAVSDITALYFKADALMGLGRAEERTAFLLPYYRGEVGTPDQRMVAARSMAWVYRRKGQAAEANEAYVYWLNGWDGRAFPVADAAACFDCVNAMLLGKDAYRSLLQALILKTPAVEDNAKFLGRLKSELEKIRE